MEIWRQRALRLGEELALNQGISEIPVKPIEVSKKLDIDVEALPPGNQGVSGMLLYKNNKFGIMYGTHIDQIGFQHFSIAHEIGHYCIPGHPEKLLQSGKHVSRAGFISDDRCELEADHFASGLLMPSYLFDKALNRSLSGYTAIEALATNCETSLTATAIRYTQRTPDVVAIIVSEGTTIKYCFMSDELKEIKGLIWIKRSTPVPNDSATYTFNMEHSNIKSGSFIEAPTDFATWFGASKPFELYEEVKGLGSYNRTLTVLSADDIPDEEEFCEEEELEESWTPRFRR